MELYQITSKEIKHNLLNLQQVVFEVTNACNLKCDYCLYSGMYKGFNKLSNDKLSFNKAKHILDYLINLWEENHRLISSKPIFIGFYGGEPLLNISLIKQIVQYVEEKIMHKQKVIFSMTTNAFLLGKHIDYLAEKDFQLLISLDGNRESSHYRKTKKNEESFPTVFKNSLELQKRYADYFRRRVNFNTVFTKKASFDELCTFFSSNFNKIPFISQINDSDINESCKDEFSLMYDNKYKCFDNSSNKKELDKKLFLSSPRISLLTKFIHNHTDNTYFTYNDLFINKKNVKIIPTGTCIPFAKKIFITATGKILQCEKISHEYTLGHITKDGVSLNLEEIADYFNKAVKAYLGQCKSCSIRYKCAICVLQRCSLKDKKTHICESYYTEEKYNNYILRSLNSLKENPSLYERILKNVAIY